jgi:Ala-tRNA(Pro) deacylase
MNEQILFDFLKTHNIKYQLFKHQPVFTCEDKPVLIDSDVDTIPGLQSKNLFLKDLKNDFFLVSVPQDKRVDLKVLSIVLGCSRFSFGKPAELLELMNLTPGSVTPFGLMFDKQSKVTFVLDEDFLAASFVMFHPLRNDMTITLLPQDFLTCMVQMGHEARIIKIPVK